jgi:small subunit ribosomal protein S29
VPKLPLIGERKALRKRIVLSNTNALEVQGMQDLSVTNMADETRIGQVLGLKGELLDQLRDVKAFKPTQNWNMFRRPGTLMRRESVELGRTVMDVNTGLVEERPRTVRRIIAGEQSTGKSLMLLQAMSMAFMNEWVVINVPEGMCRIQMVTYELTPSRSGVHDCSFCICSHDFTIKRSAISR